MLTVRVMPIAGHPPLSKPPPSASACITFFTNAELFVADEEDYGVESEVGDEYGATSFSNSEQGPISRGNSRDESVMIVQGRIPRNLYRSVRGSSTPHLMSLRRLLSTRLRVRKTPVDKALNGNTFVGIPYIYYYSHLWR